MKVKELEKKKGRPILKYILIPMMLFVLVEMLLLIGSIFLGGVIEKLDQNARDILAERVASRKNYLENEMINSWSNLELTADSINEKTQRLKDQGRINMDKLDQGADESLPLLQNITGDVISMMRSNKVTGGFVVLSTGDLKQDRVNGDFKDKPGLYFRDLDPRSNTSVNNGDLLIERAPTAVVQQLGVSTNSNWTPQFEFGRKNSDYYPFFYEPYQHARDKNAGTKLSDKGYWSMPYCINKDDRKVISYSVPLILEDGTVYGVLGADITLEYLKTAELPYDELAENKKGSYLLGVEENESLKLENIVINGPVYVQAVGNSDKTVLKKTSDKRPEYEITPCDKDRKLYASVQYLNLYNSNTPFSGQKWALVGIEYSDDLNAFSHKVTSLLITVMIVTLLIGILGSIIVSSLISRPVSSLARDIQKKNPEKALALKRTGIVEIDQMVTEIEKLNRDVVDSATKFTQILEMASARIAGYEVNRENGSYFITEHFFEMLGVEGYNERTITLEQLNEIMEHIVDTYEIIQREKGEFIIKLPKPHVEKYVRVKYVERENKSIGLVEDVTRQILEKRTIEHERDYDLLTNLMNRRAFQRIMKQLFREGSSTLKTAALVMLDLDNLKYMNDTFGHDCGDKYIRRAADSFVQYAPPGTLIARMSGDEFYIFFYGYDTEDEIRRDIERVKSGTDSTMIDLPNGTTYGIRVSGGIAWYPRNSRSYEELIRYSDFAMYKVKQSVKGDWGEFDQDVYHSEAYLLQNKAELTELIEKKALYYHFQPIVDARTGNVFAYEALMRSEMPTLRNPEQILRLAKAESKLNHIEKLTWEIALSTFFGLRKAGLVSKETRLFINSIPDQAVSKHQVDEISEKYKDMLHLVVMELTEEEHINESRYQFKRRCLERWNARLALDDYGTGYNSQQNLLLLAPDYIKIDWIIVHQIDLSQDKRDIVRDTVSYAHERGMMVVAEGVETQEELEILITLNVDYLQGYYLAEPEREPGKVPEEIRQSIVNANKRN